MSQPNPKKSKVTLEDLLRLKRHERPPAEYWVRFDRELNERVWRSMVEPKQSWLGSLGEIFNRNVRWLTVGGVSAMALILNWAGNGPKPLPVPLAGNTTPHPVTVVASSIEVAADASPDNAQALAAVARHNLPVADEPTQLAAKVLDAADQTGFHKVPAMLAFATNDGEAVRFASNILGNPAGSVRLRESAY